MAKKNMNGNTTDPSDLHEIMTLKQANNQLQQRVEFL
jgi:hypothetical protein